MLKLKTTKYLITALLNLLLSILLTGCATIPGIKSSHADAGDPLETLNRHTFTMNDTLDKNILKPVAKAFNSLPYPIPQSTAHFFNNLNEIPTVINDLLQGKFLYVANDSWRFFINSTLGIGGIFDVAAKMNLPPHNNDLGLTFAQWGYKSSAYFIIPILGPSTLRDGIAMVPNYYCFTVYPHIRPLSSRYILLTLNGISTRAQLLDLEGVAQTVSVDPYVFQRDAYLQHRNAIINPNNAVNTYVSG